MLVLVTYVVFMNYLSLNFHPRDVRESTDVTSEIGIPGLNDIGPELDLNGLNGLNGLGSELDQEHFIHKINRYIQYCK